MEEINGIQFKQRKYKITFKEIEDKFKLNGEIIRVENGPFEDLIIETVEKQ